MFGLIADLIASCTTILLPAYLSYKSIRSGDPGQTTPWLIYFIILALALLFESWTVFIIGWFPFYSWIRLFFLLYLVLPQTQGAKFLYLTYLEPYIVDHERSIDQFIGETHNKLESMGLSYLTVVVDYVRDKILGQASPQQSASQAGPNAGGAASYGGAVGNYASDLLSRFAMPQARTNAAASGGLSSMLSAAFVPGLGASSSTTSRSPDAHTQFDLSSIQAYLSNPSTSSADKSKLIQNNRDRLSTLLKALDKEQQTLDLAYGSGPGGLGTKSRSEQSFEQVSYDEVRTAPGLGYGPQVSSSSSPKPRHSSGRAERTSSGGWTSGWFGGTPAVEQTSTRTRRDQYDDDHDDTDLGSKGWSAARDVTEAILSSGSDRDRDRDRDRDGDIHRR